jgi:hypothetical protein
MGETPSYKMPMPAKLGERSTTASAGYQHADVRRAGSLRTGGMKNVDLQPGPTNSPTMPSEMNGFAPDEVISEHQSDAQIEQITQPEIEQTTQRPEPVPTSARPPEGGGESDSTPGPSDPGPTGGAKKPGYPSLLDEELNHPSGYSGKTAR